MLSIAEFSGLPISVEPCTGVLHLNGATVSWIEERSLEALRPVLRNPAATGPALAYRVYHGVRSSRDVSADGGKLSYHLTSIPAATLDHEYVKTFGHYHARGSDRQASFPEVYEVVRGTAAFILQRASWVNGPRPLIHERRVLVCGPKDRVVVPPECGHVTVNIGRETLVVAALVSSHCRPLYESFAASRGAACYLLADKCGAGRFRLECNPAYVSIPTPAVTSASWSESIAPVRAPLYTEWMASADVFAFLT
jgi:glucose-6-phosphate isomerase